MDERTTGRLKPQIKWSISGCCFTALVAPRSNDPTKLTDALDELYKPPTS